MEINFFKYQSILAKKYAQGISEAEARMRASASSENYYGDNLVTKIRRHDGTYIYQMKDCVFEEMMKYMTVMREAAEAVYNWECVSGTPKHLSRKETMFMHFVNGVKPNKMFLESMEKCFRGSPMLDYSEEAKTKKTDDKAKFEVVGLWSY